MGSLSKYEYRVEPGKKLRVYILKEKVMSCVVMNMKTKRIIDIADLIKDGALEWETDEENWHIMIFYCILDGWDRVDYLDPDAVEEFIELTYEKYYQKFSKYFGNIIDSAFYDEPQFHSVRGRMWTKKFNQWFEARKGYDPRVLYPALWYDIGEKTAFARNELLGFRASLFAEGFIRTVNEWCNAHHIRMTGHVDNEESLNPVGIVGDLMKVFRYQDIPGIDEIFSRYRAANAYKIVSSAAFNWGKRLVMCETFGGMGEEIGIRVMYKEVMEEYVKGINCLVLHAIWTDNSKEKVIFPPELSFRSRKYGDKLAEFSTYTARLSSILQNGDHIADIAVLYPIQDLQASYYMDWGKPYLGASCIIQI